MALSPRIMIAAQRTDHSPRIPAAAAAWTRAKRPFSSWAHRLYEVSDSPRRVVPMEGLRGLAVLLVFFVHLDALFQIYARRSPAIAGLSHFVGSVGNSGVDLFFVISGYLIYGTLLRNKGSFLGFLRRRAERIYPAFLAVFAGYLILGVLFPDVNKMHGMSAARTLAYIGQNLLLLPGLFAIQPIITVAWSLSYEFGFYVVAAAAIRGARIWAWPARARIYFFSAFFCGYVGLCFTTRDAHVRALMFVVGILLYEALSAGRFRRLLSHRGELIAAGGFVLSLVYAFLLDSKQGFLAGLPGWAFGSRALPGVANYQGPYKTIAFCISMFWLAAYAFSFQGRLTRWFSWAPLRYLGNMSYSYYLLHGVTLQGFALVTKRIVPPETTPVWPLILVLPVGFALTWITATMLFCAVEKPFSLGLRRNRAVLVGLPSKPMGEKA